MAEESVHIVLPWKARKGGGWILHTDPVRHWADGKRATGGGGGNYSGEMLLYGGNKRERRLVMSTG